MTAQKVIDILERIVEEDWHVYTDDAIEALQIAKETMEKEIPKVPIADHQYEVYICPNCNSAFTTFDLANEDYCPYCGQKIDWDWEETDD